MKKMVIVAVALATALCVTPVWSQQGRAGAGGPRGASMSCPMMASTPPSANMIDRLSETLQLTEDQTTKLKTALTTADETVSSLNKKAGDATKAFRESLLVTEFDAQKTKDLAAAAEKAETAVLNARIDEWVQIRAILTADQVTKLQETMTANQRFGQGQRPDGQRPQGQRPEGQRPAGPPPGDDGMAPPPGGDQ